MSDHDTEFEVLRGSHHGGGGLPQNWGFQGSITSIQSQPLVNVRLPPWVAQQWTITLGQLLSPGTAPLVQWPTPASGPLANGNNAENAQNNTVQGSAANLQPFQVVLTWGNGGVSERAVIDYPYAGCTFSFFGSVFQLNLAAVDLATQQLIAAFGNAPVVSAFAARGGVAKELGAGPLYTTPQLTQSVLDDYTFVIPIPRRARAYRLILQGTTEEGGMSSNCVFQITQMTGGSIANAPLGLQIDRTGDANVVGGGDGESYYSLQAGLEQAGVGSPAEFVGAGVWSEVLKNNVGILHPGAAYLFVKPQTTGEDAFDVQYQVQFALDLG